MSAAGEFDVWYEVPEDRGMHADASGNPWLVALLPYALHSGEGIDLDLPVDSLLLENAKGLAEVWRTWYPELRPVEISAAQTAATAGSGRVAQFFSGGVDSWFTLLRHTESAVGFPQVGQVDDLVTVWGFDIPIEAPQEFACLSSMIARVAQMYGKRHVVVATNLRSRRDAAWTRAWGPGWGRLSHGAGLASSLLLMESCYRCALIPGSATAGGTLHWGAHPLTDPLFSTSSLAFRHDHVAYGRAAKIERLSLSPAALAYLKVCYAQGRAGNCSRCPKCHRTLMCLDALGALGQASSFEVGTYLRNRSAPMLALTDSDRILIEDMAGLARRAGRVDIEAILADSLIRSKRLAAIVPPLRRMSWRLGELAGRLLSRGMVR